MDDSLAQQLEALIRRVDPELESLLYLKVYDLLLNLQAAEEIQEARLTRMWDRCAPRSDSDCPCDNRGTGHYAAGHDPDCNEGA